MCDKSTSEPSGPTSSAGGSPARTSASPERAPDSPESDPDSGASSQGSFGFSDPDSSSSRTSPRCECEVCAPFSGTLPRAGTMRSGIVSPLPPSAPLTTGTDCLWPPCACGNRWCRIHQLHAYECDCPPIEEWKIDPYTMLLPTLIVQDAHNNAGPGQFRRNSLPLNAWVGGPVNPTWAEWLMGFPIEWTDCEPSETQLSLL